MKWKTGKNGLAGSNSINIMKRITVFCGSSSGTDEIYKTKMNDLCDGVIALPGGFGTLEELFEMLTWAQLGLHKKPIGILNIGGFYDSLMTVIQTTVDKDFLKEVNQEMLIVSDNIDDLLDKMKNYVAPNVGKWITKETL